MNTKTKQSFDYKKSQLIAATKKQLKKESKEKRTRSSRGNFIYSTNVLEA